VSTELQLLLSIAAYLVYLGIEVSHSSETILHIFAKQIDFVWVRSFVRSLVGWLAVLSLTRMTQQVMHEFS